MLQQNTTFPRIPPSTGESGGCNSIPPITFLKGIKLPKVLHAFSLLSLPSLP